MSWTYSGDPSTSKLDECRFIVGDTLANEPVMQNEEIQYLIDECINNDTKLLYELFNRAATIFARDIKRRLGPQSEDPTERLKYFRDQATVYKAKLGACGISLPKYAYPKAFRKGMMSNPPWPARGDYV